LCKYLLFKDKDNIEKKSSDFLLANIGNISPLKEWLEFIKLHKLNVVGIYSLALEISSLAGFLEKHFHKKKIEIEPHRWDMLVIQSNKSGVRIVVNKDSQMVFSRIIAIDGNEFDQVTIENIQNQIIGTIEYLRRIGYKDHHGIANYLIFSEEILEKLNFTEDQGYKFYNVGDQDLFYSSKLSQKFSNEIKDVQFKIANYFIEKGRYIVFRSKFLSIFNIHKKLQISANIISFMLLFFLLFSLSYMALYSKESNKNLSGIILKRDKLKQEYNLLNENKIGSREDDNFIIESINLHNKLEAQYIDPFSVFLKLSAVMNDNLKVNKYSWKLNEDNKLIVNFSVILNSINSSYEELYSDYDNFIRDVKTEFSQFKSSYTDLPEMIDFNGNKEKLEISFELIG